MNTLYTAYDTKHRHDTVLGFSPIGREGHTPYGLRMPVHVCGRLFCGVLEAADSKSCSDPLVKPLPLGHATVGMTCYYLLCSSVLYRVALRYDALR